MNPSLPGVAHSNLLARRRLLIRVVLRPEPEQPNRRCAFLDVLLLVQILEDLIARFDAIAAQKTARGAVPVVIGIDIPIGIQPRNRLITIEGIQIRRADPDTGVAVDALVRILEMKIDTQDRDRRAK